VVCSDSARRAPQIGRQNLEFRAIAKPLKAVIDQSPGTPGKGTNPEQLFAAGWSACFEGAMGVAARKRRIALPPEISLDAEVDLYSGDGVYTLAARLTIHIPGMERETAQAIVDDAHEICPYSRATRGNIDVEIRLI
jgi:osmotically inducible protein OsmC